MEIDAARGSDLTITQLRAAAMEAGISRVAFDEAASEWIANGFATHQLPAQPGPAARLRAWWSQRTTRLSAVVNSAPLRNLVALLAFSGVLSALGSFDQLADVPWLARKAMDPIALSIGALIAARLRARPAMLLLAGLAVAQGSEFVMDAMQGAPSVRGFGAHWALMIAGVTGVLLGGRLFRRPPAQPADVTVAKVEPPVAVHIDPSVKPRTAPELRFAGM